jgi:hypothetical protein
VFDVFAQAHAKQGGLQSKKPAKQKAQQPSKYLRCGATGSDTHSSRLQRAGRLPRGAATRRHGTRGEQRRNNSPEVLVNLN